MTQQERLYGEKYKDLMQIHFGQKKAQNTDCVGISDGQSIDEAYDMAKTTGVKGVDYSKAWSDSDLQVQPSQHISWNTFNAKPSFFGLSFHIADSRFSKKPIDKLYTSGVYLYNDRMYKPYMDR